MGKKCKLAKSPCFIAKTCLRRMFYRNAYVVIILALVILAGVKISKKCQGSFGPLTSNLWGPSQYFKGPDFLISLMGLITVLLSPQNLWALRARFVLILRARPRARLILTPAGNLQCSWGWIITLVDNLIYRYVFVL